METERKIDGLSAFLLESKLYDEYNYLRKFAADELSETDVVAATLVKEASVDGEEGMRAVNQVIMNRARNSSMSPKEVVLEKDKDGVSQFSCWNGISDIKAAVDAERGVISRREKDGEEVLNFNIALSIVSNNLGSSDVGGSTHYYTGDTPSWASEPKDCFYNDGGKMSTKRGPTDVFPDSTKAEDGSNVLGYCREGNPCWKFIKEVGSHKFGIDYSNSNYLPKGVDQCFKGKHNDQERGYGIWRWPRYRK